ncbi:hypothetical protein HYDPIDRAFT_23232 [Hydnomerulius pinastri MD-312]|nr:hypothetical protein HYDPIDRAFT_23232 [Hydnomerulius pinastri MD-312]
MPQFIRPATKADQEALSYICLKTSAAGNDGTPLHNYPSLPGEIYALPYVNLDSVWGFVLVDKPSEDAEEKVVGYTLGALNTPEFEASAAAEWWGPLQTKYASLTSPPPTEQDKKYISTINAFPPASPAQLAFSPAHLHIDILEAYQGKGWGKKLIGRAIAHLKEQGLEGVWLGMDPANKRAASFYQHLGFSTFEGAPDSVVGIKVREWQEKWGSGEKN